jgi:hypothetical protein
MNKEYSIPCRFGVVDCRRGCRFSQVKRQAEKRFKIFRLVVDCVGR